jgi:hypothetical protein
LTGAELQLVSRYGDLAADEGRSIASAAVGDALWVHYFNSDDRFQPLPPQTWVSQLVPLDGSELALRYRFGEVNVWRFTLVYEGCMLSTYDTPYQLCLDGERADSLPSDHQLLHPIAGRCGNARVFGIWLPAKHAIAVAKASVDRLVVASRFCNPRQRQEGATEKILKRIWGKNRSFRPYI